VTRIAGAQADLALNFLLAGQSSHRQYPANTVILANVELEIVTGQKTQPYGAVWVNIKRDPYCLVCGQPKADVLSLEALAGDLMEEDSEPDPDSDSVAQHQEEDKP
jgi:hypothetical protein